MARDGGDVAAKQERAISREKKNTNNTICSWSIIFLFGMGVLYMLDINTLIITIVSVGITVIYNGIGSLFGAETLLLEEVEVAARILMGMVLLIAFVAGFWSNRNQK